MGGGFAKHLETLKGGKFPIEILVRGKDGAQNTQNFKDLAEKKVGACVKDKAEGPFINEWKKIFPAEIEGVEEFDVSSAISQYLAIKDNLELLSQKIKAKLDDDKFFRATERKLTSDSAVLPSTSSDSTILSVLASVST
ncbi:hypothetical protein B9Z19DRAFT_1138841 [Tuber borchii]|uniref:FACT complex subunit SPT16 N-terminal lobe domain-containing protein n=1 Tax=Tuber borchii TaxID=42251 RepID=A0A2T6Z9K7_TUBBO|nr:hypothetical protein B9Z19DRAFT_1138841 [Tuber borchii]